MIFSFFSSNLKKWPFLAKFINILSFFLSPYPQLATQYLNVEKL
jgi:hypothetical protein